MKEAHREFYGHARYYDIAFSWRNIAAECDFLEACYRNERACEPASFLELFAGPSLHAVEMAIRGRRSVAVDLSEAMRRHGQELAVKAHASKSFDYRRANAVTLDGIDAKFDLAVTLMDSISYVQTNEDMIEHLRSVSGVLTPGGLYILEMHHPRDTFNVGKSSGTDWETTRDGVTVHITWGLPEDTFDPITQLTSVTCVMRVDDHGAITETRDVALQRSFTVNEVKALVALSGCFEITAWYGSLDVNTAFDNEKSAWRMVPVLRKC